MLFASVFPTEEKLFWKLGKKNPIYNLSYQEISYLSYTRRELFSFHSELNSYVQTLYEYAVHISNLFKV